MSSARTQSSTLWHACEGALLHVPYSSDPSASQVAVVAKAKVDCTVCACSPGVQPNVSNGTRSGSKLTRALPVP